MPPVPIERSGHHFVDDDIIAPRRAARLLPEALRRRAGVRGEPAETVGELIADGRVVAGRKGTASVVVEREEQLDEVDWAPGISALGAHPQGRVPEIGVR